MVTLGSDLSPVRFYSASNCKQELKVSPLGWDGKDFFTQKYFVLIHSFSLPEIKMMDAQNQKTRSYLKESRHSSNFQTNQPHATGLLELIPAMVRLRKGYTLNLVLC